MEIFVVSFQSGPSYDGVTRNDCVFSTRELADSYCEKMNAVNEPSEKRKRLQAREEAQEAMSKMKDRMKSIKKEILSYEDIFRTGGTFNVRAVNEGHALYRLKSDLNMLTYLLSDEDEKALDPFRGRTQGDQYWVEEQYFSGWKIPYEEVYKLILSARSGLSAYHERTRANHKYQYDEYGCAWYSVEKFDVLTEL